MGRQGYRESEKARRIENKDKVVLSKRRKGRYRETGYRGKEEKARKESVRIRLC